MLFAYTLYTHVSLQIKYKSIKLPTFDGQCFSEFLPRYLLDWLSFLVKCFVGLQILTELQVLLDLRAEFLLTSFC